MKFDYTKIYDFDLSNSIKFGKIKNEDIYEIFKDGRITGLLAEYFIESEFSNINRVRNANSSLDVINDKGLKCEIKVFTKNGVSFLPSNQKGEGRKFDKEKYHLRVQNIDYFIIVDISQLPVMKIASIKSSAVLKANLRGVKSWIKVEELSQEK